MRDTTSRLRLVKHSMAQRSNMLGDKGRSKNKQQFRHLSCPAEEVRVLVIILLRLRMMLGLVRCPLTESPISQARMESSQRQHRKSKSPSLCSRQYCSHFWRKHQMPRASSTTKWQPLCMNRYHLQKGSSTASAKPRSYLERAVHFRCVKIGASNAMQIVQEQVLSTYREAKIYQLCKQEIFLFLHSPGFVML